MTITKLNYVKSRKHIDRNKKKVKNMLVFWPVIKKKKYKMQNDTRTMV